MDKPVYPSLGVAFNRSVFLKNIQEKLDVS